MEIVEPVDIEGRQTVPLKVRRKTRWPKKRTALIGALLFLFLASSTSAEVGYLVYHQYNTDLLLAQTEMQHLRTAMTLLESLQAQPFALQTVERAQQEFAGALSDAQAALHLWRCGPRSYLWAAPGSRYPPVSAGR